MPRRMNRSTRLPLAERHKERIPFEQESAMSKSPVLAALIIAMIPGGLLAQRPGAPVGSNPLATSNGYTYGNILFPGGVPTAPKSGYPVNAFASHPLHGGQYGGQFNNGNNRQATGKTRTIVVPYAYPIYFGGDYNNGYMSYGYDQQQQQQQQPNNVTVVVQQQPNPPVVINQNFIPSDAGNRTNDQDDAAARANEPPPPLRQRPAPPMVPQAAVPNDDQATIYLIALKNGTVYSAIGFGIIGNTLTYTAPNGSSSRVSMDDVDAPLSERLNRERNVQFNLGTQ